MGGEADGHVVTLNVHSLVVHTDVRNLEFLAACRNGNGEIAIDVGDDSSVGACHADGGANHWLAVVG